MMADMSFTRRRASLSGRATEIATIDPPSADFIPILGTCALSRFSSTWIPNPTTTPALSYQPLRLFQACFTFSFPGIAGVLKITTSILSDYLMEGRRKGL